MRTWLVVVGLLASFGLADAFEKAGYGRTSDDIRAAMAAWRLDMVRSRGLNDKQWRVTNKQRIAGFSYEHSDIKTEKGTVYGAFISCIPSTPGAAIRYAYSYGEPDRTQAKEKAVYAFSSMAGAIGSCRAGSTIILEDQE